MGGNVKTGSSCRDLCFAGSFSVFKKKKSRFHYFDGLVYFVVAMFLYSILAQSSMRQLLISWFPYEFWTNSSLGNDGSVPGLTQVLEKLLPEPIMRLSALAEAIVVLLSHA
jgi:hypothetical protein